MGSWLGLDEFQARCPEAWGVAAQRVEEADIPALLEQAIADAESRLRTRLLRRFSFDQLPTEPVQATETLKRLTADAAWWQLHKKFEIVSESESVERLGAAVLSEVNDLVAGGKAELIRVGAVSTSSGVSFVRSRKRGRQAIHPLTLDELAGWAE